MKSIKLFGAQVQLIFPSPRRQASHLTPFRNSPPRGYISEQTPSPVGQKKGFTNILVSRNKEKISPRFVHSHTRVTYFVRTYRMIFSHAVPPPQIRTLLGSIGELQASHARFQESFRVAFMHNSRWTTSWHTPSIPHAPLIGYRTPQPFLTSED
jgi:hypothetical protein